MAGVKRPLLPPLGLYRGFVRLSVMLIGSLFSSHKVKVAGTELKNHGIKRLVLNTANDFRATAGDC